jgi:hypothetical protein
MKYDQDKPNIALIPPEVIEEVATVFGFGAEKYGANNWRDDGDKTVWSRTYSSLQRHLNSFWQGEDLDPESKQRHLAHACTQLMILMIHTREHPEMDNRYKKDTNE